MTEDEFVAAYCTTSEIPWERLRETHEVLPCSCGEDGCGGWVMVAKGSRGLQQGKL